MATTRQAPPAAAGDDPPAAAGPDDSTEQALARSRRIREQGYRHIQAVREHVATVRRQRSGPSAGSGPVAQDPAARFLDVGEEIERSRRARARLAELAAQLVQTEETVAHIHDEMADRDPGRAAQYRRAADDARQAARRAHEIQRDAAESDPR
jgi:uncharacterized membrane protein YccC